MARGAVRAAADTSANGRPRRGYHLEGLWPGRRWAGERLPGAIWWAGGVLLAVAASAPAWLPWTRPDLNLLWEAAKGTDDAKHHMLRLFLLGWLVRHGDWFPRWVPDLFMGYGYPVFNYYAPGFYYTGLALRALFRQDVWDAYRAVGVVAALLGASGLYLLVVAVWRRPLAGLVAVLAVLYGPYVYQTNLFQRGAVPEALGLSLVPWLLLCTWCLWTAETPGRRTLWLVLYALVWAALLLTHSLTACLGAVLAGAWTVGLALLRPSRAALGRVGLAALLGAGLAAFFWLPAAGEAGSVQLEIGQEGHLDYRGWLLDLGGATTQQRSPDNRQTPAGPLDLHPHYPHQHQFIVTMKPGLGQAGLALVALAAVPLSWGRPAARRAAFLGLPLLLVAVVCWALLFRFSAPVWRLVPALALLQWPTRLMGPLGIAVAVAGAGGLAALAGAREEVPQGRPPPLDQRAQPARRPLAVPGTPPPEWFGAGDGAWRPSARRIAGWALPLLAAGGILFNSLGDREVPTYPDPKQPMDGRMVVLEEKDNFDHIGTTSGGEFTPRDVQIAIYTAGQRRGRSVFERLYPERDWLGGLFQPLAGDLRFLGWQQGPLRLSVRVANDSAQPGALGVRQFRFPGWRAWVDGRRVPVGLAPYIPEQQATLGFIVVEVPPGEHTVDLAFGPTPLRVAGMALTLEAGLVLAGLVLWELRRRRRAAAPGGAGWPAFLMGGLCVAAVLALTALVWRGVRPAFGRFAVQPAPAAHATAGVWGTSPLPAGTGGLLVNVAEAVRSGQARVESPSGPVLGPERFVDVRQLTVADVDADRGAAGVSRRQWLYLHPPSTVSVDVELPAGRTVWLQAALTLDPVTWTAPAGDGVRFQATVAPLDSAGRGGAPALVLDRPFNPRADTTQRRWLPAEADLSSWGGQTVRLTLQTLPNQDLAYAWAGWGNPVVVVREFARVRPPSAT